jgi:hypothetical protein
MGIRKQDIVDADILDADELISDGYEIYLSSIPVITTTSGTKTVVIALPPDGEGLTYAGDHPVAPKDIVHIYGTAGGLGDGYFTISTIVNDTTFTTHENIGTSTDGYVSFIYPSGALAIGYDPTKQIIITAHNVQDALDQLSAALVGGGLTETQHEQLYTLTHDDARDGYGLVTYSSTTCSASKITNYTIWTNNLMTQKIREYQISYLSNNKVSQVITIQYNAYGIETARLQETLNYYLNKIVSVTSVRTV